MPRDLSSAIYINDGCSIRWAFVVLCALTSSVNRLVLEQDEGVRSLSASDLIVNCALKLETFCVRD
jgi:hypothetical protein